MQEIIIRVPDQMAQLVTGWKEWVPEMQILKVSKCDKVQKPKQKALQPKTEATETVVIKDDAELFVERVISIFEQMATLNDQRIETNAKGYPGAYTFKVNVEGISRAMKELLENYRDRIKDYLSKKKCCTAMTVVCPMVGFILRSQLVSSGDLQLTDIEFALKPFYGESTAVKYLSNNKYSSEQELLFGTLLGLMKKIKNA